VGARNLSRIGFIDGKNDKDPNAALAGRKPSRVWKKFPISLSCFRNPNGSDQMIAAVKSSVKYCPIIPKGHGVKDPGAVYAYFLLRRLTSSAICVSSASSVDGELFSFP